MNQMGKNDGAMVDEELDWKIVSAVAEEKGVEPLELDERLYDVVDLDAVKELFVGMPNRAALVEGHVTFTLAGCEVVVDQAWNVDVTAAPSPNVAAD
ncbi:hypothetical protein NDI76_16805 [Halogeometricum sp. S1BR25-6]|uniref:Halobacterial output domain-containing protein n=1 Tax=Halogeometricum salsisoli TaxID=2950536 RepID=A0ABU2GJE5_9EURY|nr:HalOD1 output domain-containing protein [Halogeometricum sp. S1BR25-6]MDS0300409.1 hypothetical protein [Halogeometricum sp. S1BR25-6]